MNIEIAAIHQGQGPAGGQIGICSTFDFLCVPCVLRGESL